MADNEPHAVVRLLVKRMESHPEEFRRDAETFHARWYDYVEGIKVYGSEADNATITAKLREIRLAEIHEQVMDELVNGPERRRKQEEEREYERQVMQQALQRNNQMSAQQALQNTYASQLGSYQNAVGIGTQSPSQPLVIQSGGKEAMRIQTNGDIRIGNETLNEGLLKNIKKALKL